MLRVVHVYVAVLVIMVVVFVTHPPAQTEPAEGSADIGDYQRDYWSTNCSEGTYLVVGKNGSSCEPKANCSLDSECSYLDRGDLPPRMGYCVNSTCKVYCGSGNVWEC